MRMHYLSSTCLALVLALPGMALADGSITGHTSFTGTVQSNIGRSLTALSDDGSVISAIVRTSAYDYWPYAVVNGA